MVGWSTGWLGWLAGALRHAASGVQHRRYLHYQERGPSRKRLGRFPASCRPPPLGSPTHTVRLAASQPPAEQACVLRWPFFVAALFISLFCPPVRDSCFILSFLSRNVRAAVGTDRRSRCCRSLHPLSSETGIAPLLSLSCAGWHHRAPLRCHFRIWNQYIHTGHTFESGYKQQ